MQERHRSRELKLSSVAGPSERRTRSGGSEKLMSTTYNQWLSYFSTDACVIELVSLHTCRPTSCSLLLILSLPCSLARSLSLSLGLTWNPQRTSSNSSETTHSSPTWNWPPPARACRRYSPRTTPEAPPAAPASSRGRRRASPARFRRIWLPWRGQSAWGGTTRE